MPRRRTRKRPRGRSRSQYAPAVLHTPIKKKCKQWSEESMLRALEAVKDFESVQRAARIFGVPRSSLCDRTSGKVKLDRKPGPSPYLSNVEERELANFVTDVAKAGYGKSRKEIKLIAEDVANEKGVL